MILTRKFGHLAQAYKYLFRGFFMFIPAGLFLLIIGDMQESAPANEANCADYSAVAWLFGRLSG
jgi:hypothetical protein